MNAAAYIGEWHVSPWHGGEGHRAGFYVARMRSGGGSATEKSTEWLKDSKGRLAWFPTAAAALEAVAKVTA